MKYTFLGSTGLRVSELALGAMTFGEDWGWGADRDTSRQILEAYADAGGNFVDTANIYTNGTSETYLGQFLQGRRDKFVVATKFAISTDLEDPNAGGNHRKSLRRALDASLQRLGTDYIDLYWSHVWDGFTPIEETVAALDEAVRMGKILHYGFSDYPAWLVSRADALAQSAHMARPEAIQVEYNLASRDAERELLPMAELLGLGVLVWSPLAGGALTGKHLPENANRMPGDAPIRAEQVAHFGRYLNDSTAETVRALVKLASDVGCTPAQAAIAWLRARNPRHIPIVGARSLAHLQDNLAAADVKLSPEHVQALDAASAIDLGFPLAFLRIGRGDWFGAYEHRLDPRHRRAEQQIAGLQ